MIQEGELRLEWLRSFLAVAHTGGYSRAARMLNVSQPTVSTHVDDLEKRLGSKLLEKHGGKVRYTSAGEAIAADAREILAKADRLRESASQSDWQVGGALSIGASTTPGNYVLPALLGRFERENPGVRSRLWIGNSAQTLERLLRGEVDLAAVGFLPREDNLACRPLGSDEIVLFARRDHPLARVRGAVSPSDCAKQRFLIRESDSATSRHSQAWFAKYGIKPAVMELSCPETLKRLVATGMGIGLLSKRAVMDGNGESVFRVLRVEGFPIRRKLYLCWLKRKHLNRTISAFLGMSADVLRAQRAI